jgi:hypothetical protein
MRIQFLKGSGYSSMQKSALSRIHKLIQILLQGRVAETIAGQACISSLMVCLDPNQTMTALQLVTKALEHFPLTGLGYTSHYLRRKLLPLYTSHTQELHERLLEARDAVLKNSLDPSRKGAPSDRMVGDPTFHRVTNQLASVLHSP